MKCKECRDFKRCLIEAITRGQIFDPEYERADCFALISNADHIRSMSDEELAKALYGMQKEVCRHIAAAVDFPPEELDFADEAPEILNWLKQPHKEEEE